MNEKTGADGGGLARGVLAALASPDLAVRVRTRRAALGWSQASLAARAGVGQATVSRIEAGGGDPALSVVLRLFAVLWLSVDEAAHEAADPKLSIDVDLPPTGVPESDSS